MWSVISRASFPLLFGCFFFTLTAEAIQQFRFLDVLNSKEQPQPQQQAEENYNLRSNNDDDNDDDDDVKELFFTQKLDHFDPTNLATYQQRYLTTDRYLVSDATTSFAFLCVGGEGPGYKKSVLVDSEHCSGDMLELASRLSNKEGISVHVFALEHRYYGKSYPDFGGDNDVSPVTIQNLKYLSSRQALEDLAHFVQSKSLEIGDMKWVTFGGSYPGYMAGNARLKYPHLIYAAVSNSAPLELKVEFPEYKQKVGWDLKYRKIGGSDLCFDIVKQGHEQAVSLVEKDPVALAKKLNICNPETALLDRNNQGMLLGDGIIDVPAQINDPACDYDLCDMQQLCDHMTGRLQSNMTELDILADVAVNHQRRDDCLTVDWNETLNELSKPVVTDYGWRSWLWQTCTEVGFYQTCEDTCPFASFYHLVDMDLEICETAYNVTNVYQNVQASLDYYGGLDISGGSRLLTVNGDVDPWSMLGLQESPKYSLPVEMVKGASHHFWTHAVKDTDTPEIGQIREYIYSVVKDWLNVDDAKKTSLRGELPITVDE